MKMLSYELCKKLKDAGFPQTNDSGKYIYPDETIDCDFIGDRWASVPTLSELIEACGDKIFGLQKRGTQGDASPPWVAYPNTAPWEEMNYGEGKTSEEAIANLWLVLNEKKL